MILKTGNEKTKFKLLNRKIFYVINDPSSSFNYYKFNGFLSSQPSLILKLLYFIKVCYI